MSFAKMGHFLHVFPEISRIFYYYYLDNPPLSIQVSESFQNNCK